MAKVLIVYYSRSGNTAKMAQEVAKGVKEESIDVEVKEIQDIKAQELLNYDGIIIG